MGGRVKPIITVCADGTVRVDLGTSCMLSAVQCEDLAALLLRSASDARRQGVARGMPSAEFHPLGSGDVTTWHTGRRAARRTYATIASVHTDPDTETTIARTRIVMHEIRDDGAPQRRLEIRLSIDAAAAITRAWSRMGGAS